MKRPLAGTFRVARLVARESTPAFAALALLAGAIALAACARADEAVAGGRAAAAVAAALGIADVAALATAALVAALAIPRDLATGRAATLLARPLGGGGYVCGIAGGAALAGTIAAALVLAAALVALRTGILGPEAASLVAPRAVVAATARDPELPAGRERTTVGPGAEADAPPGETAAVPQRRWYFERLDGLRKGAAAADAAIVVAIRPLYVFEGAAPGVAPALVRVRARDASGTILRTHDVRATLEHRKTVRLAVPASFVAPDVARVDVIVGVPTPGTAVTFDLGRDPAGHERGGVTLEAPRAASIEVGFLLCLGALALEAAVVAAIAVLASTFLSGFVGAALALTVAVAARSIDVLADVAGAVARSAHRHGAGGEAEAIQEAAPAWVVAAADWLGARVAKLVPPLASLDLGGEIAAGRLPDLGGARLEAVGLALLWGVVAVALARFALAWREIGVART
jgi:hypothetical protein